MKIKGKLVALVDADVVAFRASAATEKRQVQVLHKPSGKVKLFDTRTEFKERLQEKGASDKINDYEFTDVQSPAVFKITQNTVDSLVNKIGQALEPDSLELYVGGKGNFRDNLPLPSKYKGNRDTMLRPINLKETKKYLQNKLGAEVVNGIEVDDMVSIRAYEELAKGNTPVICTNDKDTNQAEGVYVYDWTTEGSSPILIPELGYVKLNKNNAIKGEGLKFFASQLILGDASDHYKPTEVSTARFGAKSAVKLLDPLVDSKSVLEAVVARYKEWYPDVVTYNTWSGTEITTNWEGMLDIYYSFAYMLRSRNDKTTWKEFFIERGWNESK